MKEKISKSKKLEEQFQKAKEKEIYFKNKQKNLKLQIETEKAKSLMKIIDDAGIDIEEAKIIITNNSKKEIL